MGCSDCSECKEAQPQAEGFEVVLEQKPTKEYVLGLKDVLVSLNRYDKTTESKINELLKQVEDKTIVGNKTSVIGKTLDELYSNINSTIKIDKEKGIISSVVGNIVRYKVEKEEIKLDSSKITT